MTITRETLELAAKAAGLEPYESDTLSLCVKLKAGQLAYDVVQWRPHIDHGQLLDLVMVCELGIGMKTGYVWYGEESDNWTRFKPGDFQSFAEAVITAAAEQQLAKEKKE